MVEIEINNIYGFTSLSCYVYHGRQVLSVSVRLVSVRYLYIITLHSATLLGWSWTIK